MKKAFLFSSFFVLAGTAILFASDHHNLRIETLSKIGSEVGLSHEDSRVICQSLARKSSRRNHDSLPCEIERLHSPSAVVLRHFHHSFEIGRGAHKVVKKVIWCDSHPRIVAECDSDDSARHELHFLRKFAGVHGIIPLLGSIEKSHGKRYLFYQEYFSGGSLSRNFQNNVKFSKAQVLKIAKDVTHGLQAMHKKKIVHRDLHGGNILLRPMANGLFEAALVDFGKTEYADRVKGDIPQGARARNPPEALRVKWSRLNRFLVDVYALGCNFYQLVWRTAVPWGFIYDVHHMGHYSWSERKHRYEKIVSVYRAEREKRIGQILRKKAAGIPLSTYEKFKVLVFKMLDYQPQRRPPLSQVSGLVRDIPE